MFSSRLPQRIDANRVTAAVEAARASGATLLDLTETNPTAVGLPGPARWPNLFDHSEIGRYRPEPFGLLQARQAVAADASDAVQVRPDRVVLTASTSEAYSLLFKLLCNPGDEVLVPRPSYPLFDLLTTLDAVRPVAYRLDETGGWCLDRESVERALSPLTRAVLVVSPNNPTGSVLRAGDREWLVGLATARDLAIIADEVFAPYPLSVRRDAVSLLGEDRALVFTLGGLSKSAGMPQMKLAWTIVSGPPDNVGEALARLEIIADTYLSVSTPVQLALPQLLQAGRDLRAAIAARLQANLATLRAIVSGTPSLTLQEPDAGWSAVVRVPNIVSEEDLVIRLITNDSVLVHPGFFFDFEDEAYLVVSLLPPADVFAEAMTRVARSANCR